MLFPFLHLWPQQLRVEGFPESLKSALTSWKFIPLRRFCSKAEAAEGACETVYILSVWWLDHSDLVLSEYFCHFLVLARLHELSYLVD